MPLEDEESSPITDPLARRVGLDANAGQVADAIGVLWEQIDDALTPIIGSQGVVALYRRTVRLTCAVHPWVAGGLDGIPSELDPKTLQSVLARQSSAQAAAAGSAFLQTFHDLLASLVGPSLTERLLRSVWTNPLSGPPAQDTLP